MRTDYIDIDNGKWGIILIRRFYETEDGEAEARATMDAFGLSPLKIRRAMNILDTVNSGMTISRDDIRMSAVFVGRTTSSSQFWNTVAHELHHVAGAIVDYYGVEYYGEPSAYLYGYLLQRVVEEIAIPCK